MLRTSKIGFVPQIALFLLAASAMAQPRNPVQWTMTTDASTVAPGAGIPLRFTAKLDQGWHIYALSTPPNGPTPTTITVNPENPAIAGLKLYQPKPHTLFDANFNMNVEAFEKEVVLIGLAELAQDAKPGPLDLSFQVRFQACTEKECLPKRITLTAPVKVDASTTPAAFALPEGYAEFSAAAKPSAPAASPATPAAAQTSADTQSLGTFLLVAFGFGLAAIITPCVFPMIPITLSFFLRQPGITRGESVKQAALFCLGIVVLFTGMGLAVTALVGPFGVGQLGSNPWVNGFIAIVFVVFGLSLLGAFEITLPSGLLTKMDQASQRGGILGTLLMGLTFSLTSFACVGPFVGTLLAGSVQRGGAEPALGMMAFASGLSSPFFLLALFPSYLQRMPRSGGWLARVKVVLGFVILAASLKYLSSVDQILQLDVLTRERFLAAWFVLFSLAGLYLLGILRMEGIDANQNVSTGRMLSGAAFLVFAFSLLPGMFGGRLGELDAYVPLAAESSRSGPESTGLQWMKNDFEGALAKARQENKQVFVAFTGYACTNCHWMKANMFTRSEIAEALKGFVLVELYTDGTDPASEANQSLQESQFQTAAIPFYAIFDTEGKPVATFAGLTRKAPEYLAFLRSAGSTQTAQTPANP